ncbi:unnamed protein product, partial [marine sediment metagenome]
GVAANLGVVRAIEQVFELKSGELVVPCDHLFTGAIGAVLGAKEKAGSEHTGNESNIRWVYLLKDFM